MTSLKDVFEFFFFLITIDKQSFFTSFLSKCWLTPCLFWFNQTDQEETLIIRDLWDLRGPYCFWNDHFFIPNDHIFHCLNITQNSPNLEGTSHRVKNFIIYCHPQFPPLGSAINKESAFWLITLCRVFNNLISTYSQNCAESSHIGHAHFHLRFFTRKFTKCRKPTFSNSSQAISLICTKLCTQHLWTLLTKGY